MAGGELGGKVIWIDRWRDWTRDQGDPEAEEALPFLSYLGQHTPPLLPTSQEAYTWPRA